MKTVSASEFKAKCLAIIDEVNESGTRVIISKRGKPVAELTRYVNIEEGYPQETLKGTAHLSGNIEAPVVPQATWSSSSQS